MRLRGDLTQKTHLSLFGTLADSLQQLNDECLLNDAQCRMVVAQYDKITKTVFKCTNPAERALVQFKGVRDVFSYAPFLTLKDNSSVTILCLFYKRIHNTNLDHLYQTQTQVDQRRWDDEYLYLRLKNITLALFNPDTAPKGTLKSTTLKHLLAEHHGSQNTPNDGEVIHCPVLHIFARKSDASLMDDEQSAKGVSKRRRETSIDSTATSSTIAAIDTNEGSSRRRGRGRPKIIKSEEESYGS